MPVTIAGRSVHPLTAVLLIVLAILILALLIPLLIIFAIVFLCTRLLRALIGPPTARAAAAAPDDGRKNVRVIPSTPPSTPD